MNEKKHLPAVDRVLAENLHGLELDARCVEIAAFALALAAWRYPDEKGNAVGYRALPRLNIACVGVAPRSKKVDWLKLAGGDERVEAGMAALYTLFQKAPELGSLIDPIDASRKGQLAIRGALPPTPQPLREAAAPAVPAPPPPAKVAALAAR